VRVWFGEHVIADYRADEPSADRYAAAMQRRFAGLRVTTDPLGPDGPTDPLPGERMWDIPPK
jgi:hypothetical protein